MEKLVTVMLAIVLLGLMWLFLIEPMWKLLAALSIV